MADSNEKRKVLLGVTGSIAAYKAAELARILITRGYEVNVVMSKAAQEFISPLTFRSITNGTVVTDFWDDEQREGIEHIALADWADLVVVAPATADCLAKMTGGFADTPLLAMLLATRAPILVAPAMNVNMFEHSQTQRNVSVLRERGVGVVNPGEGSLACGWNGSGRLADPWDIFYAIRRALSPQDFEGKRMLISTGPTREALDPVRFISNRSSGKMGIALALEAHRRGAEVTLVHGPVSAELPQFLERHEVVSAADMLEKMLSLSYETEQIPDVIIMASAVCDFRPKSVADNKIKKHSQFNTIELDRNPDILMTLGERRGDKRNPVLVGFAVETGELEDLVREARAKLSNKRADLIVGNFAHDAFDLDTNRAWLIDRNGGQSEIATTYKSRVATKILDAIKTLW